jgi:hypothetical protein
LVSQAIDVPAYIIAAALGVVLCLWGVQLSRFIASITTAALLGYITYVYTYMVFKSIAIAIIFMLAAIVIGFVIGFTLFRLGLSIVFGYTIASIITRSIAGSREVTLLLVLIVIFAALIYVLSKYLLALLFAATGASLLYKSLAALGLSQTATLAIVVLLAIVGVFNQVKKVI